MGAKQEAAGGEEEVTVMFLSFSEGEAGQFLLLGPKAFVESVGKDVAAMLQGKGGGRGNTFQGRAGSFKRRKEVVELLKTKLSSC